VILSPPMAKTKAARTPPSEHAPTVVRPLAWVVPIALVIAFLGLARHTAEGAEPVLTESVHAARIFRTEPMAMSTVTSPAKTAGPAKKYFQLSTMLNACAAQNAQAITAT
jgi:hypothetical protein